MSIVSHLSLEEYLQRNDEPACELIGGELVPKPLGTLEHMEMERRLARLLERFELRGLGQVVWELSFRVGREVRIPDLVFLAPAARFEGGILVDAPLLCVEILSPSQRESELFRKCSAHHGWGVRDCWVIDPSAKKAWECHPGSEALLVAADGVLRAGEIVVPVSELFPALR